MSSAVLPETDPRDCRAAFAAARGLCRRAEGVAGEGYRAAFFLPRAKRDAMYAISAFAGLIRQAIVPAADSSGSGGGCCGGSDGVTAVVKSRIDSLYGGQIELPLPEFRDPSQWTLAAMVEVVKRFEIPRAYLHDFVDGLAADRTVRRYATWTGLQRHCELVGGSLAKVAACVLGMTHSDGAMFAAKIGVAARWVGVLRGFVADLKHDRIYLPLEDLVRFRCTERDLKVFFPPPEGEGRVRANTERLPHVQGEDQPTRAQGNRPHPNPLPEGEGVKTARQEPRPPVDLIRFEVERAREFLREGSEGLCWLAGDGSRMSAAMFVAMQGEHLDAIERAGFDPAAPTPARPSPARRLRQLSTAWRLARRTPDEPLPRVG